ncbi:MAG: hypothetical protein ABEJ08_02970 [Halobacteriaceae archaeon]
MRSVPAQAFVIVLLVAALAAGPAVGADTGTVGARAPEPTTTTIDVHVRSNGNAHVNVTMRYRLDSANETAAFRRLGAAYAQGDRDVGPQPAPFRVLVARASERTNRTMNLTDVRRSWHVTNATDANVTVGLLSLEFRWLDFARSGAQKVVVGDAFGAWTLGAGQVLRVHAPADYAVHSATPQTQITRGTVIWEGPQEFRPGEPAVTYVPGAPDTRTPERGDPTETAIQLVGALAVGALVAYAWVRRRRIRDALATEPDGDRPVAESAAQTGGSNPLDEDAGARQSDETAPAPDDGAPATADGSPGDDGVEEGAAATVAGADESGSEADDGGDPAAELLTDEERVRRLLVDNDGRMKQANIVSETGWSNAKVSQLLSRMAEEGTIEKLRIGRENLITLAGEHGDDQDGDQQDDAVG